VTDPPAWHAIPADDALRRLESRAAGLGADEAADRLARVGPNRFERAPPHPAWKILVAQFRSVVTGLLAAAMLVALVAGDRLDAIAIGAVLVLNAALGFATEFRARRAMESLLGLEVARARVVRDGAAREIDARDLVPGDVIELEEGAAVPADARLLRAAELRVSEAALTGESAPVDKGADAVLAGDTALPDRSNLVFKATTVVAGRARAVVTATGMRTEVGRIGRLAGAVETRATPLERRLDALGRRLVAVAVAVAAVVGGLALAQGLPLGAMLETAIALAVAAVPEGLPVVATITMAVGVRRMARRRALVRRLSAVEALGSATVICTDKTGTLTAGEMTVTALDAGGRALEVTGAGWEPTGAIREDGRDLDPAGDPALHRLLRVACLCNRASLTRHDAGWRVSGDPTDAALLVLARKAGLDRDRLARDLPETGELPFSASRRLMATWHRDGDRTLVLVKGAPGAVVSRATRVREGDDVRPLDDAGREALLERNGTLAARGLRVLALAEADLPAGATPDDGLPGDLTFLGLAGMLDPPAPGVPETVAAFREAGIRTLMLTGDQHLTAEAIARQLGVLGGDERLLEGAEVDRLDDQALRERLAGTAVVSRCSPEAKLRVIAALQEAGQSVAMLGDGVNDAAALRRADIGVAMGLRGTDVAREAADVILGDDRFQTIGAAVEQGRVIFANIRKFVFYLFSCNLAEILVFLGAGLAGVPAPLLPLQILWLNLVTDTAPALALALEPGDPDVMRRPPRPPGARLLSGRLLRATVGYAAAITAVTLAALWWGLSDPGADPARPVTLAFTTLGMAQIFHLGNARSREPVLTPGRALANRWAIGAVLLAVALQVLAVEFAPLAAVLRLTPLTGGDWAVVAGLGALPAVGGQAVKLLRRGRPPS
jgi:P-type Ca2+ transporter type 2C